MFPSNSIVLPPYMDAKCSTISPQFGPVRSAARSALVAAVRISSGAVVVGTGGWVVGGSVVAVDSAAPSPQVRSTVSRGEAVSACPAAGDCLQTLQFDSLTTPNVPPP